MKNKFKILAEILILLLSYWNAVKKLIFISLAIIFAIYCVSAVPISVILEDDVGVIGENITHRLIAHNDINNVTIIDYFSNVEVQNNDVKKENFLDKEWFTVKIPVGDMKKGEKKTIIYNILKSGKEAMLGGDVYYLENEKHQLFPKKVTIEVVYDAAYIETLSKSSNKSIYILILVLIIIVIILLIVLKLMVRKQ